MKYPAPSSAVVVVAVVVAAVVVAAVVVVVVVSGSSSHLLQVFLQRLHSFSFLHFFCFTFLQKFCVWSSLHSGFAVVAGGLVHPNPEQSKKSEGHFYLKYPFLFNIVQHTFRYPLSPIVRIK